MFGIVVLCQSVGRFHLNLAGSLTTDFTIKMSFSVATCCRFKITWSKKLYFVEFFCYFYSVLRLTGILK